MSIENKVQESKILSSSEYRRFQHQISLPQFGLEYQEKLKVASILIIGAGGLGAQVLQFLAASGVGKITFVDDELVTEKNIQIQTLYGGNDLGKLKTIISKQHLLELNPTTRFEILNLKLNILNIEQFVSGYDLIVDATNTEGSHYIINDVCVKYNYSWVYGHVNKFSGEIAVFNYQNGPSYRCLYPFPSSNNPEDLVSSISVLYGTVGCIMVSESIKVLVNNSNILSGKILNLDLDTNLFFQQTIERNESNFNH
jgi:sulfur-carrier protein adenylyltransferase/sulfurtransferase